jgi:hypothetical protein
MTGDAEETVTSYIYRAVKLLNDELSTASLGPALPTQMQTLVVALMLQLVDAGNRVGE